MNSYSIEVWLAGWRWYAEEARLGRTPRPPPAHSIGIHSAGWQRDQRVWQDITCLESHWEGHRVYWLLGRDWPRAIRRRGTSSAWGGGTGWTVLCLVHCSGGLERGCRLSPFASSGTSKAITISWLCGCGVAREDTRPEEGWRESW